MNESPGNDNRWYPEHPMVAVGAIIFRGERILLIKRSNESGKGRWSIPGGRLELGETLYEAARREVHEECSIEIEIERVFNTTDRIIRDEEGNVKFHFVLVDVIAKYASGETKAQSDAEECRWVTTGELVGLDIVERLRQVLMQALSPEP